MRRIIKIGGGRSINLEGIARGLSKLEGENIIVLGANALRDEFAFRLGYKKKTIRSVSGVESVFTDDEMMDLINLSYSGIRRNRFVEMCHTYGINAIGLSGIDGGLIQGKKNKGIRTIINGKKKVIRDQSGKPVKVNVKLLEQLLVSGYTPVITIPILGQDNEILNTENDQIVSLLQREMLADEVIHFIEANGIIGDDGGTISQLEKDDLEILVKNSDGRFRRKLMTFQSILENSAVIRVVDGRGDCPITDLIEGKGTTLNVRMGTRENLERVMTENIETEKSLSVLVTNKRNISLERGKGLYVWDLTGRKLLDCSGGWGVALVGHSNDSVIQGLIRQMSRIMIAPITFGNSSRLSLMRKLVEITPSRLNRVFLANSGTESIEAAIKFALQSTGRKRIVSATKAFHGRSLGALSVTHSPRYRNPFKGWLNEENVDFISFNSLNSLEEKITGETAAVILEPVQGEGGVNLAKTEFIKAIRKRCDDVGALLIFDEVQTGFGRTGRMFAFEWYGIEPDILCLAKGIAGGFPMGAVLVNNKVNIQLGSHGSTFGGNPMACAAALASLNFIIENNLVGQSEIIGKYFLKKLEDEILPFPNVRSVRGKGLMIAVELKRSNKELSNYMHENGIIVIPTGRNAIRFLPPLIIEEAEIDFIVSVLKEGLQKGMKFKD